MRIIGQGIPGVLNGCEIARVSLLILIFSTFSDVAFGFSIPFGNQDSIVVNGRQLTYVAEVNVDTLERQPVFKSRDWWVGAGWDIPVARPVMTSEFSTMELVSARPQLVLEHQLERSSGRARLGAFLAYSQPWSFDSSEVSTHTKGWLFSSIGQPGSGVQQVALIPDSLAPERDTLLAPLSPGHAIRLGVMWEGKSNNGWYPRLSISTEILRPSAYHLKPPADPTLWPQVHADETYHPGTWYEGRLRFECGGVVDLGDSYWYRRSSIQMRPTLYWIPGLTWGLHVALIVSPTRR